MNQAQIEQALKSTNNKVNNILKPKWGLKQRNINPDNILTLDYALENFPSIKSLTKTSTSNYYVYINVGHYSKEIFNIGYGTGLEGKMASNKSVNFTHRKRGDGFDTYVIHDDLTEKDAKELATKILDEELIYGNMCDLWID